MSALTIHLREPGDHGALAFHPACPVCREQRLLGTLADRPLLSTRTQAALAAGVLAASSFGPVPAVVAAGEPPSEREGQVAPEDPTGPGDSVHSPDFDPGGPDTELPVPVGPEDIEADSDAPGPVETEPEGDPGLAPEPPMEPDVAPDSAPSPGVQEQPATDVPPPQTLAPAPVPKPPPAPSPAPVAPAPQAPAPAQPVVDDEPKPPQPKRKARRKGDGPSKRSRTERAPHPPSPPEDPAAAVSGPTAAVAGGPEPAAEPVAVAVAAGLRAKPGDRLHVVQRGESLWSIARDVLGPQASIAEVAREVNRLWELNRERIATGDPDLILPGTRLRLG